MNYNWQELLDSVLKFFIGAAWKIVLTVLILIVGFKLIKFFIKIVKKSRGFAKLDAGVQTFLISGLNILLKALLLITIAAYLGIPMASMITVLGSAGLAIGLALQGSLTNVSGGVILLIFKPFRVGDYISVGAEGGTVTEIGLFYTYLRTPDNRRVIVPNGEISNKQLVNSTTELTRRVDLRFSVAYGTNIKQAKELLLNCAFAHALVAKEPQPFVCVPEYADSAVVLELRVWCKTEDYWTVKFDLNESVKAALDDANMEIPFPQMEVRIAK